jgi:hypothetical protein
MVVKKQMLNFVEEFLSANILMDAGLNGRLCGNNPPERESS